MKLVERSFEREIDVAPGVVFWNYWDHEHLYVVHDNYTNAKILFEDERMAVYLLTYRLPLIRFLTSKSLNVMIQRDEHTIQVFNLGLFSVPSITTITVEQLGRDRCRIGMNYKFLLFGWRRLLGLMLPSMIETWNEKVWVEDLPLKLRRQRVLRHGFRDFHGMPQEVDERNNEDELELTLPVTRHRDSPVNMKL
ncbi:MAG: hypothetical protein KTR31_14180 [Myxococcales bacterium]|nr:hypothetical protein [Myxococcales bacterium]